MKNAETAKRLSTALTNAGMIPQELADRSGVSKASISQYINGSHAPSNLSAGKMADVLYVNPLWLMGFDAPMEKDNNESSGESIELTDHEQNLVNNYRQLDPYDRGKVDGYVESLVAEKYEKNQEGMEGLCG